MSLNPPKGIRVRTPEMVRAMRTFADQLSAVARSYGAEERDYSVLEQRAHLMRKYGDDEKLIYELQDQGGQPLALRYDLTTQHMLYDTIAIAPRSKTYQCGKVYRRESTSNDKQRFREFYQFDVDYRGYASAFARRELLVLLCQCLRDVIGIEGGRFTLVINDRVDVDRRLQSAGVPEAMRATVCSSIDKYDGTNWDCVLKELVEKGVEDAESVKTAFSEPCATLDSLVSDLRKLGVDNVLVQPTMVRGLAYYTGLLFEVVPIGGGPSISGGGEYGDFIGFSLGLDRLLVIDEQKQSLLRPKRYIIATEACYTDAIEIAQRARNETNDTVDVETIATYKQIRRTLGRLKKHSPDSPCMIVAENDLKRYRETNVLVWK